MVDIVTLSLEIDAKGAKKGAQEYDSSINKIAQSSEKAVQSTNKISQSFAKQSQDVTKNVTQLKRLLAANKQSESQFKKLSRSIEIDNKVTKASIGLKSKEADKLAKLIRLEAKLEDEIKDVTRARNKSNAATGKASKSYGALGKAAGVLKTQLVLLASAFGVGAIIKSADAMNQLEIRLKSITGSAKAGADSLGFLRKAAAEQSVDLLALSDGFNRLIPSVNSGIISMDQLKQLLKLTNDNIKAFGLNASEAQGAFLGLSQTFGSGTVTLEDLRQVTDRFPGLLNALATSMGKTVNEFKDFIATGQVTADLLSGPLLEALEKNEGAAAKLGDTYSSATTKMGNSTRELFAIIGDTGVLDTAVGGVNLLTKAIDGIAKRILSTRVVFNLLTGDVEEANKSMKTLGSAYGKTAKEISDATKLSFDATRSIIMEAEEDLNSYNRIMGIAAQSTEDFAVKNVQLSSVMFKVEQTTLGTVLQDITKQTKLLSKAYATNIVLLNKMDESGSRTDAFKKTAAQINLNISQLKRLTQANKKSEEQFKKTARAIELENKGLKASSDLKGFEVKAIKELVKEQGKLEDEIEKVTEARDKEIDALKKSEKEREKAIKKANKEIQKSYDQLQDGLSDIFVDVFEGGEDAFENFADNLKSMFFKLLADMAAQAILNAIIIPVRTDTSGVSMGGGGAGGLGSLLGGGATGGAGGGGGIGSLLGGGSGGLLNSLAGSGAGQSLSNFLGIAPTSSFVGPPTQGLLSGLGGAAGTSLAGLAGGAIGGVGIGSTVAGLTGGNSTGGAVGGALGGLAGTFFGGPIGGAIGSAIGGALGGLIGGDEGEPISEFGQTFGTDADVSGVGFFSKRTDTKLARQTKNALDDFVGNFEAMSGADIQGFVRGGQNREGENFFEAPEIDKRFTFDKSSPESAAQAMAKLSIELIKASDTVDDELIEALESIQVEGKDAAQILREVGIATGELAKMFEEGIQRQIDAIQQPFFAAMENLRDEFDVLMKEAFEIGADVNLVKQLERLRVLPLIQARINRMHEEELELLKEQVVSAQILANRFDSIIQRLTMTIDGLRLSQLSPLSPQERLNEARTQFDDVSSRAALGDIDALEQLSAVSLQFLQESRNFNATNEQFAKDFAAVELALNRARDVATRQRDIQQELADSALAQIKLLTDISAKLDALIDATESSSEKIDFSFLDVDRSKLLRDRDSVDKLKEISPTTRLPVDLNRQIKVSLGFDFSAAENQDRGFKEFLQGKTAVAEEFNRIVTSLGGRPIDIEGFANGGTAQPFKPFIVGEEGPELISPTSQPVDITPNGSIFDDTGIVVAINELTENFTEFRRQSAAETIALRDELQQARTDNSMLNSKLERMASK